MSGKMYHCNICDCEVSIKCKNKHLKTKKHNDNLNKNNEDDNDKKQCARCFKKKNLDLFKDNNITCNYCLDVSSAYRKNNPEKTAEWKNNYFQKIKKMKSILVPFVSMILRNTRGLSMKAEQGINILWNCLKIISFRRKGFKEILPYILV